MILIILDFYGKVPCMAQEFFVLLFLMMKNEYKA